MNRIRVLGIACATMAVMSLGAVPQASADPRCARVEHRGGVGPYDFRTAPKKSLGLVEGTHFTPEHQANAMRGEWKASNGTTFGNLNYTLRAFPNHARALYMMGMLQLQLKRFDEKAWQQLTLENTEYAPFICYFERAARFAPDDAGVPNSLGILLHRAGNPEEALKAFQRAVELAPDAPEAHYNLGLAQFALEHYEQAAEAARRAYQLGYRKQDLKVKLQRKGHWK